MEELIKYSKKQLFYARVRTLASIVTAGALIICLFILMPVVLSSVAKANDIMEQATQTITLADTALESITEMSNSITEMGDNMDTLIMENAESIETVMKKIEAVDFEGLNNAIKDLGTVIEPLANFFGKF